MFLRQEKSLREFMSFYPIVSIIIIINIVLWLLTDFSSSSFGQFLWSYGVGSNLLIHEGEYWRLVTPIFLHSGLRHVLFNSFAITIFGPALEQMLGRIKFVLIYLLTGIIANLATFIIGPTIYYHVGASGAVYGILGVYLYMVFYRKDLIGEANQRIVIIISLLGLVMTFIQPNINIYAHIFGYIAGLALAPLFLVRAKPYSIWRSRYQAASRQDSQTIKFDPNRWQKKRIPTTLRKNFLWIVLGILVLFAIIGQFL